MRRYQKIVLALLIGVGLRRLCVCWCFRWFNRHIVFRQRLARERIPRLFERALFLGAAIEQKADAGEERRILEIVLHASNLETAGDVIQLNLADRIKAKIKEAHAFTEAQNKAVDRLCLMIQVNMRSATAVLTSRDVASAQALIAQKDAFRSLENKIVREHLGAKKTERGKALRRSALFIDLIRDLHRINSHVVAVGYPIVDQAGLLRESRLRKAKS